jgi:sterol desaturase/sphingolipid hydroxylase (fatty acid hydroxylase superfamily)
MEHQEHHSKFTVNYSFPHPFMDLLHNTFYGSFAGKEYRPAYLPQKDR